VPPNFFKDLKSAVNNNKLKNFAFVYIYVLLESHLNFKRYYLNFIADNLFMMDFDKFSKKTSKKVFKYRRLRNTGLFGWVGYEAKRKLLKTKKN
jgi:hypothetical protein